MNKVFRKTDASMPSQPPKVDAAIALCLRSVLFGGPTGGGSVSDRYEILITHRLLDTVYGGYWEFPGGKVEPDEAATDAAAREVREELGLDVQPAAALAPVEHRYEHAHVRLHPVLCTLIHPAQQPQHHAVADHRWVRIDGLPWDVFLPANVRLVTALLRWMDEHDHAAILQA